ncbi:malonyl-[acyl-carrier protein] O-methyltransferase BioC, partial [Pseudomonas syringae pv. tagetis]
PGDGRVHLQRFRHEADYRQLCAASGLRGRSREVRPQVLHYPDVLCLTHELNALGAHNLNPGRPNVLTGRERIMGMVQA